VTTSAIARAVAVAALGLLVVWAMYLASNALLIVYISVLLAIGFGPVVHTLQHQLAPGAQRAPRWLAILIVYVTIVGVLTVVGLLVIPPLIDQAQELWRRAPELLDRGQDLLMRYGLLNHRITLEEAVRRAPDSVVALERLGIASRSVEMLRRALAIDDKDAAAWHQLGLIYLEKAARSDAQSAFQKAIAADPDLSEPHNSLGGLFLESGDIAHAEPELREAIRIQPDYAEAHSNLANVLASTNRFPEARYHFEAAIHLKPDYAAAHYNYGVALAKANRIGEATQQIEAAIKSDPNFQQARNALQILKSGSR